MERDILLFGLKNDANHFKHDPWELPRYFLLRHKPKAEKQKSLRTHSGYWKENEGEFIAIRSGDESSSSGGSPSYVGVRKTLEFYLKDGTRGGEGTKTDWIMHEYQHLRKDEAGAALFLEEDVALRKVFRKGETDQASSLCRQVESCVEAYESRGNVWQHFTKIRTEDPDLVYAACHRCDKVLKAHPKIHGISQLERHINSVKCRSSCGNPSRDEDRQMLHRLRTELHHPNDYEHQNQNMDQKLHFQEDLAQLDPWDLNLATGATLCYVTSSFDRQTPGGIWKEVKREFTAIRMDQFGMHGSWNDMDKDITAIQLDHQLQMQVPRPQYIGLRRTLQFYLQNGNKTDWTMFEYQQIDDNKSPALFLRGGMVMHMVFHHDKDDAASALRDLDRLLNGDYENESYCNGDGVNVDTSMSSDYVNGGGDKKRKRTCASSRKSDVWMHFTEIRTTDHGVVYAVCHYCDRGYNGDSRNGTSHLKRHNKKCSSKHPVTGNANDVNTSWEAEMWPLLLHFKNYGGGDVLVLIAGTEHQGCVEARSQEHGPGCSR